MKTICIGFVDFIDNDREKNLFCEILSNRYNIEVSDDPDYLIYSCAGNEHLKYDCIRIFYTGECITPDFNECDYAIGFDRMEFGDRYLHAPLYSLFEYAPEYRALIDPPTFTMDDLRRKTDFCSFVYSNCWAQKERVEMLDKLSLYKNVNSGGRYRNNIGGAVKDKKEFQSKHKFSIAFENSSYDGYSTEKIMEAFAAGTIPIYYGDPRIHEDFNEKAFINCSRFDSLDSAIEEIKRIDQDDELYLAMRNEPPLKKIYSEDALAEFLYHIFDQDIEKAGRRPHSQWTVAQEKAKLRHRFFEDCIYKYYRKGMNQFDRLRTRTIMTSKRTK